MSLGWALARTIVTAIGMSVGLRARIERERVRNNLQYCTAGKLASMRRDAACTPMIHPVFCISNMTALVFRPARTFVRHSDAMVELNISLSPTGFMRLSAFAARLFRPVMVMVRSRRGFCGDPWLLRLADAGLTGA